MVNCERFVNSRFTSNTYIIYHSDYDNVWVVDPGDTAVVLEWMQAHSKTIVTGVLLTHSHFDHMYGINEIITRFPSVKVYVANEYGKEALNDAKKNGSKYTEDGALIIDEKATISFYDDTMQLWEGVEMRTINTPGHSDDSRCFIVDGMLFTGDTLIKDVRTVTKLKGGSVEKLVESINAIAILKGNNYKVMPGHGEAFALDSYDLNIAIEKHMFHV